MINPPPAACGPPRHALAAHASMLAISSWVMVNSFAGSRPGSEQPAAQLLPPYGGLHTAVCAICVISAACAQQQTCSGPAVELPSGAPSSRQRSPRSAPPPIRVLSPPMNRAMPHASLPYDRISAEEPVLHDETGNDASVGKQHISSPTGTNFVALPLESHANRLAVSESGVQQGGYGYFPPTASCPCSTSWRTAPRRRSRS